MGRVPLLVKMRGITCIRVPTWKCGIQCKINNVGEVILNLYNSQNLEYLQSEGEYGICFIRRNEFNIYNIRMYVLNTYNIRRSISIRRCSCICSSIVASQDSSNHIPEKSSILQFDWLSKMYKEIWVQWLLLLDCQLYHKYQKSLRFPRSHPQKVLDLAIWLIVENVKSGWETIIVIVDCFFGILNISRG